MLGALDIDNEKEGRIWKMTVAGRSGMKLLRK